MSNVLVEKNKIDILANAISDKSGEPVTMTLDEMVEAVDGIETGGITPTGNIDITQAGVTDVTEYATATVPTYIDVDGSYNPSYYTSGSNLKWRINYVHDGIEGWFEGGQQPLPYQEYNAIPTGTTVTPTTSAQTIGGANTMMQGAVTVNAVPTAGYVNMISPGVSIDVQVNSSGYVSVGTEVNELTNPISQDGYATTSDEVWLYYQGGGGYQLSTQAAATITPTESSQTAVTAGKYTTGAVTVGAISSSYVGSGITRRSSSDLTASGATVTVSSGYYSAQATKSVASGTAGTPTATKGTVSNHSISITPSVTNTGGYISGGTINGTAVTVSASELASGNKAITANGTGIDVVGYATVSVDVQGGGGSPVQIDSIWQTSVTSSTVTFTNLQGEPTSFILMIDGSGVTPASTAIVDAVVYDGSNLHGQTIVSGTNAVTYNDTAFSKTYSNGTLTITSSGPQFNTNQAYILNYSYGGSASNIDTKDVQVGSGATSITFTGLEDEPVCWSCIFKSNFGTSSGYQRVILVDKYGSSIYGHAMDSATRESASYWTASYNNGSLTITSQGTNQGGYFHQPGYYQLTYAVDSSAPQYESVSKTYRASTSAQSETITPSSGYDAMSEVNITIPAVTQTNLTAANIKSGTTVTISNGQSNLWSVTGTYSGGSSKNVQVLQSTTRTNSSSLTKVLGDLTVSKTGTYDVYWSGGRSNTSTSYTWGTRLYVDGSGYGTENTSWTNNCQSNHLSNVSLTANQKLSVYARGRTGSYYTFVPMLTIVEA